MHSGAVQRVIRDVRRYGDYREPTDADRAKWREENVSFREWVARNGCGGRADLKELVEALLYADDVADEWVLMATMVRDADDRKTERRAELKRIWKKGSRAAEDRRKVKALFEERRSA